MKQSLQRLLSVVFVFSPAKSCRRPGSGGPAGRAGEAAAPFHSGEAPAADGGPPAARHRGASELKGERPSERSGPAAALARRDSMLRARSQPRGGSAPRQQR